MLFWKARKKTKTDAFDRVVLSVELFTPFEDVLTGDRWWKSAIVKLRLQD